jgi:hypothetical protein
MRYDQGRVDKIKGISGRQWHADKKVWSLPREAGTLAQLQTLFAGERLEIDPALYPAIDQVARRDLIDYLLLRPEKYYGRLELTNFLSRVWDLSAMPSTDGRFSTAEGDIYQHMVFNNDWEAEYLLYSYLRLLDADTSTFLKFLEECIHPIVLQDDIEVRDRLFVFNEVLTTHGYALEEVRRLSGRPVYKARLIRNKQEVAGRDRMYEVVLSFAGEEREYVRAVARHLQARGISVFYDEDEEVAMWGKDLTEVLSRVYGGDARFCVMFISKSYAEKMWPRLERRNALFKAVERGDEYLLPARFDNAHIDGLTPSIKYVDLAKKTPDQLADMITQKLRQVYEDWHKSHC